MRARSARNSTVASSAGTLAPAKASTITASAQPDGSCGDTGAAVHRAHLDAGVPRAAAASPAPGRQLVVRLQHHLGGARTPGLDVARQGEPAAADVDDPDALGRRPGEDRLVQHLRDPLDVLELQPQRVGRIHPGLLGLAVDHHERPTVVGGGHQRFMGGAYCRLVRRPPGRVPNRGGWTAAPVGLRAPMAFPDRAEQT